MVVKPFDEKVRVPLILGGESRVEQSHRKECNINSIMAKYRKTGLVPARGNPGFYGDFSNVGSYQESCDKIKEADKSFMSLPATVRKEFNNNPALLLNFLEDPDNKDKAIELGILPPEVSTPEPIVPPLEPIPPVSDP